MNKYSIKKWKKTVTPAREKEPEQRDLTAGIAALQAQSAGEEVDREDVRRQEFSIESLKQYRYFHYEDFRSQLAVSSRMIKDAGERLRADEWRMSVSVGFPENTLPDDKMVGQAVLYDSARHPCAMMYFDRDTVLRSTCYNWRCGWQDRNRRSVLGRDLCEHEVILLLLLEDYLADNSPGDCSNINGLKLLDGKWASLAGDEVREEEEDGQALTLVPVVEIGEDGSLKATFRVGSGKLYKINRLSEFRDHVNAREEMKFGKSTVLRLSRDRMDERSQAWFRFIDAAVEEDLENGRAVAEKYSRSYYYSSAPTLITSAIPLKGARIDSFFELCEGDTVECTRKDAEKGRNKGTLKVMRGELRLRLFLHPLYEETDGKAEPDRGHLEGVELFGEVPVMIHGHTGSYYVTDTALICCDSEESARVRPITDLARNGWVSVKIGRLRMSEFYRKILPKLRTMAEIVETDVGVVEEYLPPEPHFIVYLDVENDSAICRADVRYGERSHTLLELIGNTSSEIYADNYRDEAAEHRLMEVLLRYLPHFDRGLWLLFARREEDCLFDLLDHGLEELMELAEIRMTDAFRRLGIRRRVPVSVGVSVESSLLDLEVVSEELTQEELIEILFSYEKKRRFIRLKNGDFLKLEDNDTVEQLSQMLDALHITPAEFVRGKMHIPAYRALYLDRMLEQTQDIYTERDRHFRRLIKEFKTVEDADFVLPHSLKTLMRKYQTAGYRWLRTLDAYGFGGILADEMGLGKTLQVLSVLLAVKLEREQAPEEADREDAVPAPEGSGQDAPTVSLVVCPASLVYNWCEEAARFAPELRTLAVAGTKPERMEKLRNWEDYDVLVTSYDLLKRDIDAYQGKRFRFEVIDEAQFIKNPQTAAAKAVKVVDAVTKYALTGTPIENRLSELWSIFDYLMPGFLYDYGQFRDELETQIVKYEDERASERLRMMISPFVLRRRKKDVLKDLPDKLEEVRYAGMEEKQRKLYDAQVLRMKQTLAQTSDEDFRRSRIQILAELTRIRQLCCDPSLLYENYDGSSAKREACIELVRSAIEGEHKMLIFSQFTSMLELLAQDLRKENIPFYTITGATPKEKRLTLVNAFNADDTPVFLISLKAGGTGLNLTGADIVIHYDPWWNVAAQNQATDRAHRIGQEKIVTVYRLIMRQTIEEKILEMQESKSRLAEDILGGENVASSSISREDLMALLDAGM